MAPVQPARSLARSGRSWHPSWQRPPAGTRSPGRHQQWGATTPTDSAELLYWGTRIGGRYMGPERADEYGRRNAVPPEMVVRVKPSRIVARVNLAD